MAEAINSLLRRPLADFYADQFCPLSKRRAIDESSRQLRIPDSELLAAFTSGSDETALRFLNDRNIGAERLFLGLLCYGVYDLMMDNVCERLDRADKKYIEEVRRLGRVYLSGLNFVLFERLSVQGVSSKI